MTDRVSRTELSWSGWGDPAHTVPLSPAIAGLLRDGLGVSRENRPPAKIEALALEPVRLPREIGTELAGLVGAAHVRSDHEARARHAVGRSTLDLLALRSGRPVPAPDLVLAPSSHEQILALLEICRREHVAAVPFGGGTSVVGGLAPEATDFQGLVAIDLRRMDGLLELDAESRLARLQPGLRGPEAEARLGARGYTLGHFPQSFEFATLGGFAAVRSSGQASAGYGRFDELVMGLKVATPAGTLELGRAPRSAAGPDLRQLILGSEGALGVITEILAQIRPAPETRRYEGWRFQEFTGGLAALRSLAQDGPLPTVLRLSDEAETALGLARPEQLGATQPGGCLAVVGYEGTAAWVGAREREVSARLRVAGAQPVADAGENWFHGRFQAPYLRDALIDAGALVETLETAAFWSALPGLYAAVGRALRETLAGRGTPPVVLCHVSHVYPSGASLYFTVACAQGEDPIVQWREAKAAALEAITAAGGSISHHHGVGTDHRPWLSAEIGEVGVALLRSAKLEIDPTGILNPGVLLPAA